MPPISATDAQWPPVRPAEADDGEPGELEDPDCVVLGDVELADAEPGDPAPDCVVPGDVELADAGLELGDPEPARDVTVNCSMAMGALPPTTE